MKIACPFCAEQISGDAIKCKHCGESLEDGQPQKSSALPIILIVVAVCGVGAVCFIAIIAAIAIPNLIEARKHGNESAAIGALKTMGAAQALFREADKEGDDMLDYASLSELASAGSSGLIDSVLGSGTKQGYIFECTYSSVTCEFLWFGTASPAVPETTGDRYFATNHQGVTFYSATAPIPMNNRDCSMPADRLASGDIRPVGR